MNDKILQPGEMVTFKSAIKKDDNYFMFSLKAFCHGTYYVIPLILSNSLDSDKENTILITDFSVSY